MTSIFQQGLVEMAAKNVEFSFKRGFGHALEAALHFLWQP